MPKPCDRRIAYGAIHAQEDRRATAEKMAAVITELRRVKLAKRVERNLRQTSVSIKDARLTMSRELVDFLEQDLPSLITAVVQLIATVVILATFHFKLALCVLGSGLVMLLIYTLFHQHFMRLNSLLNDQLELQSAIMY